MKLISMLLVASVVIQGCGNEIDTTPPKQPQGIRTTSLDEQVQIDWLPSQDDDVKGYNVWLSNRYDGLYELIGTTDNINFIHYGADNGVTYYYAVSAFDFNNNESVLSTDVVYDTPRPEGYRVRLYDHNLYPDSSGYSFSSYTRLRYNDDYTDIYLETSGVINYIIVNNDTGIQDMGYTYSLDDISSSPTEGWVLSGYVEAIPGHTYVIMTYDNHYAKVRITDKIGASVLFDWAYQTAQWNTELKIVRTPKPESNINKHVLFN